MKNFKKNLSNILNGFENIKENGAFAQRSKCSIFHNVFKYMIFQRPLNALLWNKGLIIEKTSNVYSINSVKNAHF